MVFEVTAAEQVLFKELRRRIEGEVGHRLDDAAFIRAVATAALATDTRKPSSPSYQIAVTVCERCEEATMDAARQVVAIDTAALEQAMCDCHWMELDSPHVGLRQNSALLAGPESTVSVRGC